MDRDLTVYDELHKDHVRQANRFIKEFAKANGVDTSNFSECVRYYIQNCKNETDDVHINELLDNIKYHHMEMGMLEDIMHPENEEDLMGIMSRRY